MENFIISTVVLVLVGACFHHHRKNRGHVKDEHYSAPVSHDIPVHTAINMHGEPILHVPQMQMSHMQAPQMHMPPMHVPDVHMPPMHVPDVHMPTMHVPDVHMPTMHIPTHIDIHAPQIHMPSHNGFGFNNHH